MQVKFHLLVVCELYSSAHDPFQVALLCERSDVKRLLSVEYRLAVMGEKDNTGIGNIGHVRWQLCLCLLLAWTLVALFVCKGIKSSGKVSYYYMC